MGNKIGAIRPARHILSMYKRATIAQVVDVLKSFKSKFSFQAALLSRDEFSAITVELYRNDVNIMFDHLTKTNPFVVDDHMLSNYVGSVEFFISLVLLCSPGKVSFNEKLDMVMALCQFRPTSENMPLGEPDSKSSKEQIRYLFESTALILSKVAHVRPPSYAEIVKITNEIFGESSSFVDTARERDLLDWEQVKLCIQCNANILAFLSPFLNVINLMDRVDAINSSLLEIRAQVLKGVQEDEAPTLTSPPPHGAVTDRAAIHVMEEECFSTDIVELDQPPKPVGVGSSNIQNDEVVCVGKKTRGSPSVSFEAKQLSVENRQGGGREIDGPPDSDGSNGRMPVPPPDIVVESGDEDGKSGKVTGKPPKKRRPSARKKSAVAALKTTTPKPTTPSSAVGTPRRMSLMRDKMQQPIEHISEGEFPSSTPEEAAVGPTNRNNQEQLEAEPEQEQNEIAASGIADEGSVVDVQDVVVALDEVALVAPFSRQDPVCVAPTAVPPMEPVSSSAKNSTKRRLFKPEVVVHSAPPLDVLPSKRPPGLIIPPPIDTSWQQLQTILAPSVAPQSASLINKLFSPSKLNSKRHGVSIYTVNSIDKNVGVQNLAGSTGQYASEDSQTLVPLDNCMDVLLSNRSISVPELNALELCTIEKCLHNMMVEDDKISLVSFLELCRCILSFNVVGISSETVHKNVISCTQLSVLFCLTHGVGQPLPNRAIIVHTGLNLLAHDANLSDDIVERATLLHAYHGSSSRASSPIAVSMSPRSPHMGYASAMSSPRGLASPRAKTPFHNLIVQYLQMTRRSVASEMRPRSASESVEIADVVECKPETTETGSVDGVENVKPDTILKPSLLVGALSTVCSVDGSRCTTPDSVSNSASDSEDDSLLENSTILISRAAWIYHVDQNKCNGIIDEKLLQSFTALVASQQVENMPKEEALLSKHIPSLVKSRIGEELLDMIGAQLTGPVKDVADAHVDEVVHWFMETVVPDNIDQVLWIDVHRQTRNLVDQIEKLDAYVRQLCN